MNEPQPVATQNWIKENYSPVVKIHKTLDSYRNPPEASAKWNLEVTNNGKFYIIPLTDSEKEALNHASIFTYCLTNTGYIQTKGAHFNYTNLNGDPDDSAGDVYYTGMKGLCIKVSVLENISGYVNLLELNIAAI